MQTSPVLVRLPAVMQMTGLARSTIYRLIAAKKFPLPVKLSERSVAWRCDELGQWCETRERALRH
jgi:prophage regulatory protein